MALKVHSMTAALRSPRPYMNVTAFRDMIARFPDEERWELLDGEPVLMAPQSERHQRILGNLLDVLRPRARDRGCVALAGLGLLNDKVDDYAPIPDIVVRCGPMVEGGYATDPVLVAEVLSPSTMRWDRGGKVEFYQSLASLQLILLVYQDEIRVEAWQRAGEDWSPLVRKSRCEVIALPELGGELAVADIYEGIPLES